MKAATVFFVLMGLGAAYLAGFGYGRWYGPRPAAAPPGAGVRRILYYVDPMHPSYKSDKPGIAPDCGMQLEPVYADQGLPGGAPTASAAAMPPGTIQVSAEKQQMIGVRYGTVDYAAGGAGLRAPGRVAQDETRVARVHSKIEGWIEKVLVDFTGQQVEKGQPLVTLYSPDMLATEQEYLLARRNVELMQKSGLEEAVRGARSLVEAARRRLELWDLSPADIDEIGRTGTPIRGITLRSPAAGFVTARNAFPSQRITPETELYVIGDLSRVWILADVFESDLASIRAGQEATVALPDSGGHSFRAHVDQIVPQVDPATRTLKVRLDAANPGVQLKPDMYVEVTFSAGERARLSVPVDAVLDTGLRKTVFVDRGNGRLEPRAVETGERFRDRVEILSGLKPGERIVTSGTFLLDSESQMRAGTQP